jgi:6-phosphogluconolactonase (cycloisomerase 2 family)
MPFPSGFAADTLGRLFFTGWNTNSSKVATTSAGVPSVVSTLTPNNIFNGSFGLIHPAGFYMVADRDVNKVGVFRITGSGAGTTLAAVAGSPFATGGSSTHYLALNETGKYLYAGNRNSGTITRFFVDGFSGGLAKVDDTTPVSAGAMVKGIVYAAKVTPGGFFYTLSNNAGAANYIYGYRLDQSTGALSLLNGFPVASGGNGDSYFYYLRLAYDALNRRLYALNGGSNTLSAFNVNPFTGALTALPYSPYPLGTGETPNSIAVHPQGSPVLVGGFSQVKSFNVTATTISPAAGSPLTLPSSTSVSTIVFSRDGAFAYTGESVLHGLSVNQASGVITLLAGSPFSTTGSPIPGPIDASGRLYASLMSASALSVFTLNNTGAATTVHTTNFPGPGNCVGSTLHPAGYLVVACQIGIVGSYKINGSGAGTTLSPTGFGSMPGLNNMAHVPIFDSQYQYLVIMNVYSTLTSYKFDASSGGLSPAGFMPQGAAGSGTFDGMVYAQALSGMYLPMITR